MIFWCVIEMSRQRSNHSKSTVQASRGRFLSSLLDKSVEIAIRDLEVIKSLATRNLP